MKLENWYWGDLKPLHYGLIHADPAYHQETYSDLGKGRSPKYDTMNLADIKAMPVMDLAAPDCLLAMWTTNPHLEQAFDILDAWGFIYSTVGFVWVKTYDLFGAQAHRLDLLSAAIEAEDYDALTDAICPIGMGYWTRQNPELCLLARHNAPLRLAKDIRTTIIAPVREHSRKPDQAMARLERLVAGPYVELNSRTTRPGWDCWGNEIGFFDQEEFDQ